MRLNQRGRAIHGLTSLNLDGRPLLPGVRTTAPVWLSSSEVAYQVEHGGHWSLEAYNIERGTTRAVDAGSANELDAGESGIWAAWNSQGVRSNGHPTLPLAGLRGVGRDGTLGYSRVRQDGTGLILRALDGTTAEYAAGVPIFQTHVVRAGIACYTTGGRLVTIGTPAAVTVAESVYQPRLVEVEGVWWVLYHTEDRLLFQPVGQPVGYVVQATPTTFSPDVVEMTPGVVRIVWSTTEGEGTWSYRVVDLDTRIAPRVPLMRPVVAPLPSPIWTGYFFADSIRYGSNLSASGSCTVVVESGVTASKPVVLADVDADGVDLIAEWAVRWTQVLAVYVARESSPPVLALAVAMARARMRALGLAAKPVIAYAGDALPTTVGADLVAVQCYPSPGESDAESDRRWRNTLQRVQERRVVLVCAAYDRNGTIAQDVLLGCQARYPELARGLGASCWGLLWFSDGRPGGTRDHPDLRPWHIATVAAATVPVREKFVHPPKTTFVGTFPGLMKPGWKVSILDTNNPGFGVDLDVDDGGSFHATLINPVGKDRSINERKVV